ncbi:MAG: hypothetical protein ACHQFZ_11235 [Acidimicrobiales bacterium]
MGEIIAMLAAVHFNVNGMSHPLVLLRAGVSAAPLWRLSMVLDILGYYLLVIPLFLLLRTATRPQSPKWVDLFTLCLLGYALIGAMGAAVLATALPTLITAYAASNGHGHLASVAVTFTGYTDGVYRGLWNLLEQLLAGVGWIGYGLVLRSRHRRLGLSTLILGTACLVDSLGTALNIDAVASTGLIVYLVLAPIWAATIGAELWRNSTVLDWRDLSTTPNIG